MKYALWILQVLLALLFLFAGGVKLVMTVEQMNAGAPIPLPGLLLRFVAVCEILGAIGLILPSLLRIRPELTPLAAWGLVIIMIGATALSLAGGMVGPALFSLVIGILCTFVAYGRRSLVPIHSR
jgi:uncharacterized membrane protein YphA (DoxX/SURF4 family)